MTEMEINRLKVIMINLKMCEKVILDTLRAIDQEIRALEAHDDF